MVRPSSVDTPPFSAEAEQAVLGAVLLAPESWDLVRELLRPEDFYDPKHQVIWESFHQAHERHGRADGITALESLRRHPKYGEAIRGYVAHLPSFGVSPAHARASADIVRDWSLRRRSLRAAQIVQQRVLEGDGYRSAVEDLLRDIVESERAAGAPDGLVNFWEVEADTEPFLIDGFIKPQQRMFFFGGAEVGKSMLMMQAAVQASAGLPVLGKWEPTRKLTPLYVDLEMGRSSVADRRETFERAAKRDVGEELSPLHYWLATEGLDLSKHESRQKLENAVAWIKPDLLIIDPFYKVLAGDMYSPSEIRPATAFIDFIRAHFGCAVWLGHHNKKPSEGRGQGAIPQLHELFGGSILQWWPEFVFVVAEDRLVIRKSRERWLKRDDEIPLVKGGKWWATATSGTVLSQSQKEVLDFLMECGTSTKSEIAKGVDLPGPDVGRILRELGGLVRKARSERGGHPKYEAVTA